MEEIDSEQEISVRLEICDKWDGSEQQLARNLKQGSQGDIETATHLYWHDSPVTEK
jgi:hypothetical protein